jgi:hypothetical protein
MLGAVITSSLAMFSSTGDHATSTAAEVGSRRQPTGQVHRRWPRQKLKPECKAEEWKRMAYTKACLFELPRLFSLSLVLSLGFIRCCLPGLKVEVCRHRKKPLESLADAPSRSSFCCIPSLPSFFFYFPAENFEMMRKKQTR